MLSDTIFVGSTNPVKVNAAQNALSDTLEHDFDAQGIEVPSGVADQPMTEEETRLGAINRIKAMLAQHQGGLSDAWYVAIEGGVDVFEDGPATFAFVAIYHEGHWSVSRSASLPLPVSVFQALQRGEELGRVMDRLFDTVNVKQKGGAIGLLTLNHATRQSVYEVALTLAMAKFHFPDLYTD
ncbi:inosine/xanthosine triphosphatase [Alteromonas sp. V450]|uniref:inosine/xanthosine triphosphatase n=1 Tax=Alteromonas sp. V450 TaxID=1912139 RepID=UPI0008FF5187|nr:inosine/xanthosine triphosphatase [Alteromonas sp. V450]OJF69809.1 inosine/xanthosine triphosphatase [Alteromonas sp. V450]|tara:strand:- start:228 stop:773 length:546 start_codon:yes stop_codon:yes gene_type:complete